MVMAGEGTTVRSGRLWRHRDFVRLWAGQTVSLIGSQITLLALPLTAILALGASAFQMGLLQAATYLPWLLFGLFAGVWVDRLRRRPLMILADIGRFLVLATIPVAALLDLLTLPQVYLVALAAGALTVLFDVAYSAYLPSLVAADDLVEGNSKLTMSESTARLAGPSAGGLLVDWLTAPVAILFDALSYLVSAAFVGSIRAPEPAPERGEERDLRAEIREGLRLVLRQPLLRTLTGVTLLNNLAVDLLLTVFALYAVRELGVRPSALGLIVALASLAELGAAALTARATARLGIGTTAVAASLACAAGALLLPAARGPQVTVLVILVGGYMIWGMGVIMLGIISRTLRQSLLPAHLQGRAIATQRFITWGAGPFAALAAGFLGEAIGLRQTLAVGGGLLVLMTAWVAFSPLRHLREQPATITGW